MWNGPGRPQEDRRALARGFIAKAVWDLPTTRHLIDRLKVDPPLRRLCGWSRCTEIPSEATFSRAFADDQVVWRSLQTYRGLRRQARPRLAKSAGFTDALIVQEALRAASDTGETLNAVDTFDAAMQRFPRTSSPRKQSDEGRHPPTHHGPAPTHSHGGRNEIPVPLTWRRYRLGTGLTLPSAVHVPRFNGSRAAVVAQGAATEVDLVNSWTI